MEDKKNMAIQLNKSADFGELIPDFAIERMAKFLLPIMQQELPKSTHLSCEEKSV